MDAWCWKDAEGVSSGAATARESKMQAGSPAGY
jgi:hypothetical protein